MGFIVDRPNTSLPHFRRPCFRKTDYINLRAHVAWARLVRAHAKREVLKRFRRILSFFLDVNSLIKCKLMLKRVVCRIWIIKKLLFCLGNILFLFFCVVYERFMRTYRHEIEFLGRNHIWNIWLDFFLFNFFFKLNGIIKKSYII